MLFARTLDVIFELTAIVREELGHLVDPARYIAIDCGPERHGLTDVDRSNHRILEWAGFRVGRSSSC